MNTESIQQLIEAEAKKLAARQTPVIPEDTGSIFQIGAKLFIRTVTHYQVGRVCHVGVDEIGLVNASWIADSGPFAHALKTGELREVEYIGDRISVGRGAIIDVFIWRHALPAETK